MKQVTKKFHSGQPIIAHLIALIPDTIFTEAVAQTNADM
jgi:hypothetical protein